MGFLRSALYLAIELRRSFLEPRTTGPEPVDLDFAGIRDPWRYETSPLEQARFRDQTAILDSVRQGHPFLAAVEIGCAEGAYTEILSGRCRSLLVLDISPTALERTRARRDWGPHTQFLPFDLARDPIPGSHDLIVITGVLEYFSRRRTLRRIRQTLVDALNPGGYLLVETTRANPNVERDWWSKFLIRGRWINEFISRHPSLVAVHARETDDYCITLCRSVMR